MRGGLPCSSAVHLRDLHGLLTLSLLTPWYHELFAFLGRKPALNYGFDKVRFIATVPSGPALLDSFRLARVDELGADESRGT